MPYDSEHGKLWQDIKADVDKTRTRASKFAAAADPVRAAKLRVGMDWILTRKTVLAELGRMMVEEPTERDLLRFQAAVEYIALKRPKISAKAACAYVRRQRLGETERRERVAALHHELNAAINLHRQRFPESSWADVKRALDLTTQQIERKLAPVQPL